MKEEWDFFINTHIRITTIMIMTIITAIRMIARAIPMALLGP
jgi:hypothetical protein